MICAVQSTVSQSNVCGEAVPTSVRRPAIRAALHERGLHSGVRSVFVILFLCYGSLVIRKLGSRVGVVVFLLHPILMCVQQIEPSEPCALYRRLSESAQSQHHHRVCRAVPLALVWISLCVVRVRVSFLFLLNLFSRIGSRWLSVLM